MDWLKSLRIRLASVVAAYVLVRAANAAVAHLPAGEAWALLGALCAAAGTWLYLERKGKPPAS